MVCRECCLTFLQKKLLQELILEFNKYKVALNSHGNLVRASISVINHGNDLGSIISHFFNTEPTHFNPSNPLIYSKYLHSPDGISTLIAFNYVIRSTPPTSLYSRYTINPCPCVPLSLNQIHRRVSPDLSNFSLSLLQIKKPISHYKI